GDVEDAAMGDRRHPGAGIASRDPLEGHGAARSEYAQRFAAPGQDEIRVARLPARIGIREVGLDLVVGAALEVAIAALAQAGVRNGRDAEAGRYRCGGIASPGQVAGVDRHQPGGGEAAGQALRLPVSLGIEPDVAVALEPTLAVPGGHPVADQPELGRNRTAALVQASLGFRVKVPVIDAWPW